eukprot:Lankesteria_metandrocarpae@DN11075_c0_g1_i1.p1
MLIKSPMDISTLEKRVETNFYFSTKDLICDEPGTATDLLPGTERETFAYEISPSIVKTDPSFTANAENTASATIHCNGASATRESSDFQYSTRVEIEQLPRPISTMTAQDGDKDCSPRSHSTAGDATENENSVDSVNSMATKRLLNDFLLIPQNAKTLHMPNNPMYHSATNLEVEGLKIFQDMFCDHLAAGVTHVRDLLEANADSSRQASSFDNEMIRDAATTDSIGGVVTTGSNVDSPPPNPHVLCVD